MAGLHPPLRGRFCPTHDTQGDVEPIFILGKQNVEKHKRADELKSELTRAESELASRRSECDAANSRLERLCVERAKLVKDTVRSSGSHQYQYYNKADYQRRAGAMVQAKDRRSHQLTDDGRESLLTQLRATLKPTLGTIAYRPPPLSDLLETVAALLSTTVVSAAMQCLKDDAKLSRWVHEGLGLHRSSQVGICLFCAQPMPQHRMSVLEAHFNAEYERFLEGLESQLDLLESAIMTGKQLVIPSPKSSEP